MLERDALADLTRHVTRNDPDELLIFNPLPWARTISGPIGLHSIIPRGLPDDCTSGRLFQGRFARADRCVDEDTRIANLTAAWAGGCRRRKFPPWAMRCCRRLISRRCRRPAVDEDTTIENHRYRLTFDREHGRHHFALRQATRSRVDRSGGGLSAAWFRA